MFGPSPLEKVLRTLKFIELENKEGMLKAPPLKSSGLHILVFQDRSERGAFNMFEKVFLRPQNSIAWLFFGPIGHHRSDNYIIIPIDVEPKK